MKGPVVSDGAVAVFTTCGALAPQLRLAPSRPHIVDLDQHFGNGYPVLEHPREPIEHGVKLVCRVSSDFERQLEHDAVDVRQPKEGLTGHVHRA
jgi:hypothetical protein